MAALFIAKRGIINIYRAPPRHYNNNTTLQSSRCFASQGSDGAGESLNEAPDVSVTYAADTAKEGLKRATKLANETIKDAPAVEDAAITVAGGEDEKEGNVTVGEIGAVMGKHLSSS